MNVVIKQMNAERVTLNSNRTAILTREYLGVIPVSHFVFTQNEIDELKSFGNGEIIRTDGLTALGTQIADYLLPPMIASRGINIPNKINTNTEINGYFRQNFFQTMLDFNYEIVVESGIGGNAYYSRNNVLMLYEDANDEEYYLVSFSQNGSFDWGTFNDIKTSYIYHNTQSPYLSSANTVPILDICSKWPSQTGGGDPNYICGTVPVFVENSTTSYALRFQNTPNSYTAYFKIIEYTNVNRDVIDFFEREPKPNIANCTITVEPLVYLYDGQPKTPTVSVYNGENYLSEGTDYIKTYENNIYAGTAAVLIAGIGEYIGSKRVYFTISESGPAATEFRVTLPKYSYDYTGEPITPPVNVVTTNGTILTEGTDYLKTYENNTNIGQASVLVAGINDYSTFPSKRVYFSIVEPSPEPTGVDYRVTLPKYSYDYTGEPITPYVNVVTVNGVIMVEGTDYQKTYQNNTLVGQASVLVVGINDYANSGSKIVYFTIVQPAPDPYSPIGPSGPEQGQGTFNPVSDTLPEYTIPTMNISNTGFTRIYNPTLSQVQALAQYMWTDPSFFQTLFNKLIQVFENPMDAIIAFNIVPCAIPDGGTEEFKVLYLGTGVQMTVAGQQYVAVDCGTLTISEFFGSALDYNPFTKISCYLPYIGTVDIDTDEVMTKTMHLIYTIDIVSGACIAQIYIDGIPIYQFSGHCAQYIPMAASDFSSYVSALIGISKIAAGAIAAGSAASALSNAPKNAMGLQLTGQTIEKFTAKNFSTGRQNTIGTRTVEQFRLPPTKASFASQVPGMVANTVGEVISSKLGVSHTGSFSGSSGFMAYGNPFIRIERPKLVNPSEYGHYNGRPSMISVQLNQLSGYTVVQQVQLTGFTCTQPEIEEIDMLLKGGVVF